MMRRHAGRLVLWGGRPGVDRQYGSAYDKRMLELEVAVTRFNFKLVAAFAPVMRKLGVSANEAMRNMSRAFDAYNDAMRREASKSNVRRIDITLRGDATQFTKAMRDARDKLGEPVERR